MALGLPDNQLQLIFSGYFSKREIALGLLDNLLQQFKSNLSMCRSKKVMALGFPDTSSQYSILSGSFSKRGMALGLNAKSVQQIFLGCFSKKEIALGFRDT